jgi:hypothetical protein
MLVLGYGALALAGAAAIGTGAPWWLLPVLLLDIVVIGSLNVATRGVVDLREQHLDERQRGVALVAYRRAYKLVNGLFFTLLLTSGAWVRVVGDLARPELWLLGGLFVVVSALQMLPTAVVAWTEPDA